MIDLDRLDADLSEALTADVRGHRACPASASAAPPNIAPAPEPGATPVWEHLDVEGHGRRVVELVAGGRLAEADLHIAAHADLAHAATEPRHRRDAAAWAVMRTLLDGRVDEARAGLDEILAVGRQAGGVEPDDVHAVQRLGVALASGDGDEGYGVLDHCRRRAWVHGDRAWRGRLVLLLARLGRGDEARRELVAAVPECLAAAGPAPTSAWLDEATDLTEAAALLGAADACATLARVLPAGDGVVVAGRAWLCKGSSARFRALAAARAGVAGTGDIADESFAAAAALHRRMGAPLLLAATLGDWGRSLAALEPLRAAHLLGEEATLTAKLLPVRDADRRRVAARAS